MYILLKNTIGYNYVLFWLLVHTIVIYYRFHITHKYNKIKDINFTLEELNKWSSLYMIGTTLTGLIWGSIFYFIQGVPTHYYFIIFGVNVGLASAGLLTLGTIASIYFSFLFPIVSLSIIWMLLQNESIHTLTAFISLLGLAYYLMFAKKYANNFMQVYLSQLKIQDQMKELKNAQAINQELQDRTELALRGSGVSVLDWNFVKRTSYISPNWKEMLGYKDSELPNIYSTWKSLVHEEDLVEVLNSLKHIKSNIGTIFESTHRLRHKDGHYIWIYGKAILIYSDKNKLIRMIGTHTDISEQKKSSQKIAQQQEELKHLAQHDTLTGLPNRLLFNDRLTQAMNKAKRSHTTMALFFIDLDHFKEINDSLGHEVGDLVLQEVTQRIIDSTRSDDKLARLGGDEFTVIVEGLEQGEDASYLAQKIVTILAQPIFVHKTKLYVTSSIGISLYPDDGDSVSELVKYADSAMYKAKDEGRNNYQFYKREMTELALERVIMEANLRDAIKNREFIVYYQPQVNAKENKIIGMEALVRWNHPILGLIPPNKFIPLAESTGLIVELDRYVMQTAMSQLSVWYQKGYEPGVLAMNLAIKHLRQKDFFKMFTALIQTTHCRAEYLELEITESQIMTNPEAAIKSLKKLSALNIELAIDDFGTGYSSLSYLKKLPINKLKIDQSFVKGLPHDDEDAGIAKAVIALANSLKLRLIAEGVETEEQKEFLIQNGCDNIQGYFYSKPVPAEEFENLLKTGF